MAKNLGHYGKVSRWKGTFTTVCGQVWPLQEAQSASPWFTSACPECKRIKRGGR